MPKKTTPAHELLTAWLTDQRRVAGVSIAQFCREVAITPRSCWQWRTGRYVPSFPNRHRIESVTKGAVPATAWQS